MRTLLAAGILLGAATMANAQGTAPVIEVLKQASCGCCGGWVERMQEAGFTVEVKNVSGEVLSSAKQEAGFAEELWGCHTANVGGYTIEGHVPAREITRLLSERPAALGIATPGMPAGSPGMEYGNQRDAYEVLLVKSDGSTEVYASYPGN